MTYDCSGCRKTFYIYSERHHCKTCRTNFCIDCKSKNLINKNPPICLRKCTEKHVLKIKEDIKKLDLCAACHVTIRKNHFTCTLGCDFHLCLSCAAQAPNVDTKSLR